MADDAPDVRDVDLLMQLDVQNALIRIYLDPITSSVDLRGTVTLLYHDSSWAERAHFVRPAYNLMMNQT